MYTIALGAAEVKAIPVDDAAAPGSLETPCLSSPRELSSSLLLPVTRHTRTCARHYRFTSLIINFNPPRTTIGP